MVQPQILKEREGQGRQEAWEEVAVSQGLREQVASGHGSKKQVKGLLGGGGRMEGHPRGPWGWEGVWLLSELRERHVLIKSWNRVWKVLRFEDGAVD